jgi:hypothetical protein
VTLLQMHSLTTPAFHAVKSAKERLEKAGFKQIQVRL